MTGLLHHKALGCADLLSDIQLVHPTEKRPSKNSGMLNRKKHQKKTLFSKILYHPRIMFMYIPLDELWWCHWKSGFLLETQLALLMASPSPQNHARQLETNTIVQFCSLCQLVKNSRKTKWSKGFQIVKCCIATRMHPVDLVPNNTHWSCKSGEDVLYDDGLSRPTMIHHHFS